MSVYYSSRSINTQTEPSESYDAPSLPLYIAAFIVMQCGLLAVGLVFGDQRFSNLTMGLATIGIVVSYTSRRQNVGPKSVEVQALIFCIFLALIVVFGDRLRPYFSPSEVADDRAQSLGALLTWLVVFGSFILASDGWLLFTCVPTLAMFGLVGHMTTEPMLLTYFVMFISSAAFMLVHESYLQTRRQMVRAKMRGTEKSMMMSQLTLVAVCGMGSLLLARTIVAPIMENVGSRFAFSAALVNPGNRSNDHTVLPPVQFQESQGINVGYPSPKLGNQIVMRVRAELGANWRGATFNEYTGHGWRNSFTRLREIQPQASPSKAEDLLNDVQSGAYSTFEIPTTPVSNVFGGSKNVKQQITLTASGLFNEIYAAPECRVVKMPDSRLQVDDAGTIHLARAIQTTIYTVLSHIPTTSREHLNKSPSEFPGEISANYLAIGTVMPPAVLSHIKETALRITAGHSSEYDKVEALRSWVADTCKYNSGAAAYPMDADVTSHFLFTIKQGDCNSFATALAVLCRSIGIPARVASGFLPGILDTSSGEYLVRERDKHLWTEVYFANSGWVPFDATDGAEDISESDEVGSAGKGKGLLGFIFSRGILPPIVMLLFLAMLGYVIKVEIIDRLRRERAHSVLIGLPESNVAVVASYELACRILARKGIPRAQSVTPREYLASAAPALGTRIEALEALDRLTTLVVKYRYGRETASEEDVALAAHSVAALRTALKGAGRRTLSLGIPLAESS